MITYYSSDRKTPDVYTQKDYSEICIALGVSDEAQKKYFKETIERSAVYLLEAKKSNVDRLTENQEKTELQRLADSLKKSREIFDDLCSPEQKTYFRIFSPLKVKKKKHEEAIQETLDEVFGKYSKKYQGISAGLFALEQLILNAKSNPYVFGKDNGSDIVLRWLWGFSDDWEEISSVKFAKGNEYDSPCSRILQKMIDPINARLPLKQRVTSSTLDTVVIKHNNYKKAHPEEFDGTGYFD